MIDNIVLRLVLSGVFAVTTGHYLCGRDGDTRGTPTGIQANGRLAEDETNFIGRPRTVSPPRPS